jgi:hypothetical protein
MSRTEWRVDAGTHIVLRRPPFLSHRVELNGQRVSGHWRSKRFPFGLADGRFAEIHLTADALSRRAELSIDGKIIPDTRYVPKDLRCPACKSEIQLLDEFCSKCGHALGTPDRFINHRSVQGAATAIRILAVLFAVFGLVTFYAMSDEAQAALENLSQFEDDEILEPIDGVTYTAGDLRRQVLWEHRGILVVNLILCALMLVLAWWSKSKPLAAILIATSIYAVVLVTGAIMDPRTIVQGIIMKIIVIAVLARGIKGALSLRVANG